MVEQVMCRLRRHRWHTMSRMLQGTVGTTACRALLAACTQLGLNRQALLSAAGLTMAEVEDPDGRLGIAQVAALWQAALDSSDDPSLGLRMALAVPFGAYRVIDFLAAAAPTVGEGITRMARYFPLVNTAFAWRITHEGSRVHVALEQPGAPDGLPRSLVDYALVCTILHLRHAHGFAWPLVEVTFAFPAPPVARDHEAALGCPVRFGQSHNAFVMTRATWDLPSRAPSCELLQTLEAHAARMLANLESSRVTSTRVAQLIVEELEGGDPSLARIAGRMALSPRTLQRRLGDEQTTFADVLDETRRHVAEAYVKDRGLALTEVAYLLGFSEQSAFTRAFQRWWGVPPSQVRSAGIPLR